MDILSKRDVDCAYIKLFHLTKQLRANQKQELPVATIFVALIRIKQKTLYRIFH